MRHTRRMRSRRTYALFVTLLLVGSVLLLLLSTEVVPKSHWSATWLIELARVLLIGGVIGLVDRIIVYRDYLWDNERLFKLHETTTDTGLIEIGKDSSRYDFSAMIRDSKRLAIVANDGRTWISSRITDFQHRFCQDHFTTELFVLDPDSLGLKVVATKTGYSELEQQDKVRQAQNRLIDEYTQRKHGTLRIYHIPHFPTHSVFLADSEAVFTLYGASSGRRTVPFFRFEQIKHHDGIYWDITEDIEKLKSESRCFFDSDKK